MRGTPSRESCPAILVGPGLGLVDPVRRRMDLVIMDERPGKKSKRRQPAGARLAHQNTMKLKRVKKRRSPKRKARR